MLAQPCLPNPINQNPETHVYRLHIFVELSHDADEQSDLDPAPSRMLALASITSCRLRKLKSNNTTTFPRRNTARHSNRCRDSMAAMVTGIGDGTVPDEFEADDIVGIDH